MITGEHNNCVLRQTTIIKNTQQLPHLRINIGTGSEISSTCSSDSFFRQLMTIEINALQDAFGMRILLILRNCRSFWKRYIHVLVHVPVVLRHGIRIMGVCHGNRKAKRLVAPMSHMVIKILGSLGDDLLVIVELVRAYDGAGFEYGGHTMIPVGTDFLY